MDTEPEARVWHLVLRFIERLQRPSRILGGVLVLLFISTSCSTPAPRITITQPKVYTDDHVLKTFAERRSAIRKSAEGISTETIQELLRIKQQSQLTLNIAAAPTGTATTPVTIPTPQAPSELPKEPALTLPPGAQLRKRIALDQEITGYELLYLGDARFLNKDVQAVLVRIDVSIHNYSNLTSWYGSPNFVFVAFRAKARTHEADLKDGAVTIYSLQPEYSSLVAEESLLSSRLESYTAQASAPYKGFDITGTGSYQRSLEEGFLSLIETPVQFAIYTNKSNEFAYAFGPRRRVNKRSWINPARIFGDTYNITYVLDPGARQVFAILLIPITATELTLEAYVHQEFLPHDQIEIEKQRRKQISQQDGSEETIKNQSIVQSVEKEVTALGGTPLTGFHTFTLELPSPPAIPKKPAVIPTDLYAGTESQLLITSMHPVTADTEVFIGSFLVPKENVTVLGRYRLKVKLSTTKDLSDTIKAVKADEMPRFPVNLVIPGYAAPVTIGEVTFKALK